MPKEPSGEQLTKKDFNGEPSKTNYVAKEPSGERSWQKNPMVYGEPPSGEAPKPYYEVVAKESSGEPGKRIQWRTPETQVKTRGERIQWRTPP